MGEKPVKKEPVKVEVQQQQPAQPVQAVPVAAVSSTTGGMSGGAQECVCEPATGGSGGNSSGNINCEDNFNKDLQSCVEGNSMITTKIAGVEQPVSPKFINNPSLGFSSGGCTC